MKKIRPARGGVVQRDRKRTAEARRGAFTLLELIVALAIFVGAVAALSRLEILAMENAEYARWQAEGWSLVESKMAELEAGLLTRDDAGSYPSEEYPDWEWTLTFDATEVTTLYQLSLTARQVGNGPGAGITVELHRLWFEAATEETTP